MTIFRRAVSRLALLVTGMLLLIGLIKIVPVFMHLLYPLHHTEIIAREAESRDVDPGLVAAVINVESSWRDNAVSPKGAAGLMQLMPSTAEWVAEQVGVSSFKQQDLFQPELNIRLGTWYLANLLQEFDQNLTVAVAAYNGGRGNVEGWLRDGIWDGSLDDAERIPFAETRRYVIKVLHQYGIYQRLYKW